MSRISDLELRIEIATATELGAIVTWYSKEDSLISVQYHLFDDVLLHLMARNFSIDTSAITTLTAVSRPVHRQTAFLARHFSVQKLIVF